MDTQTIYKYRNYLRQEIATGKLSLIKEAILNLHEDYIESISLNNRDLKLTVSIVKNYNVADKIRQTVYEAIVTNCSDISGLTDNEKEEYINYLNSGVMLFDFYRIGNEVSFSF